MEYPRGEQESGKVKLFGKGGSCQATFIDCFVVEGVVSQLLFLPHNSKSQILWGGMWTVQSYGCTRRKGSNGAVPGCRGRYIASVS